MVIAEEAPISGYLLFARAHILIVAAQPVEDRLRIIQLTALRMGVQRLSSRELEFEVRKALEEIDEVLANQDRGSYKLGDLVDL